MKEVEFRQFTSDFLITCDEMLRHKGMDYNDVEDDRLSNFKWISDWIHGGKHPEMDVWMVFILKHVTAVRTWASSGTAITQSIRERFIDIACYAVLGAALAEDIQNAAAIRGNDERSVPESFASLSDGVRPEVLSEEDARERVRRYTNPDSTSEQPANSDPGPGPQPEDFSIHG